MKHLWSLLLLFLVLAISCKQDHKLTVVKILSNYPSASGIEYFNNQLYVIGDDANSLLVLDSNLAIKDSVILYSFPEKRIPKNFKPDLEAAAFINKQDKQQLLLLGSGSLPVRNTSWLINPITFEKESIRLDTFYNFLQINGVENLNIEGLCSIKDKIILSNRGHKGWPHNFLVITNTIFFDNQEGPPVSVIRIGGNTDSSIFSGVSGLAYAKYSDLLLLTVSTEDTRSSTEDGAIGKSSLWIIENISSKLKWEGINPNKIIDLEEIDDRFHGQKIESVCVIKEDNDDIHLVLAADNDDGSSTLFKVIIKK